MKTTINIITKKTNAGHFNVFVMQGHQEIGEFNTTDMQLIDDIYEMNNDGFESELVMHNSFEEVIKTCFNKIV